MAFISTFLCLQLQRYSLPCRGLVCAPRVCHLKNQLCHYYFCTLRERALTCSLLMYHVAYRRRHLIFYECDCDCAPLHNSLRLASVCVSRAGFAAARLSLAYDLAFVDFITFLMWADAFVYRRSFLTTNWFRCRRKRCDPLLHLSIVIMGILFLFVSCFFPEKDSFLLGWWLCARYHHQHQHIRDVVCVWIRKHKAIRYSARIDQPKEKKKANTK